MAPPLDLKVGKMVALQGLAKRADINGAVGRVDVPASPEESASLTESGRVKVALCRGGNISVKPDNLVESRDTEWRPASQSQSIWELVQLGSVNGKFIGDEDQCDVFVRSLWDLMFETPPPTLLHPFHEERANMLACTGHKFFWFALDAVAHHFALELCGGRWRVHQSFVRELPGRGYTATQWGYARPCDATCENEAWHLWGGGRELSSEQMGGFLADLAALIRESDALMREELLPQVPGWTERGDHDEAVEWASTQLGRAEAEGVSVWPVADGGWHVPGEPLHVSIGGEVLLSLSPKRAATLTRLFRRLTGEPLSGLVPLRLVNYCFWRTEVFRETGEYAGFTMRGADLGVVQGEEEGRAAVEKSRRDARERVRGGQP